MPRRIRTNLKVKRNTIRKVKRNTRKQKKYRGGMLSGNVKKEINSLYGDMSSEDAQDLLQFIIKDTDETEITECYDIVRELYSLKDEGNIDRKDVKEYLISFVTSKSRDDSGNDPRHNTVSTPKKLIRTKASRLDRNKRAACSSIRIEEDCKNTQNFSNKACDWDYDMGVCHIPYSLKHDSGWTR